MGIKSEFSMLKNNVLDILDNPKYIVQIITRVYNSSYLHLYKEQTTAWIRR